MVITMKKIQIFLALVMSLGLAFFSAQPDVAHASWFSDGINKIFGQSANNSETGSSKVKPKKLVLGGYRKHTNANEYAVVTKTADGMELVGEWLLEIKEPSNFQSKGHGWYFNKNEKNFLKLTDSVFDMQGNCIFGPMPYPRRPGADIILDKGEYILRICAKSPGRGQSVKCSVKGTIVPLNLNARRDIATIDSAQEIAFGTDVRNAFFEKSKEEEEKDKYHYYTFSLSSGKNIKFDLIRAISYWQGTFSLLDENGNFLYILPTYVNDPAGYYNFIKEQHYLEAGRYYVRAERGKIASAYCFSVSPLD